MPSGPANPLKRLVKLATVKSPGPTPSFSPPHVLLVFFTVASATYVGRATLAERSKLGAGAIRTVLAKLRDAGYLDVIRAGCFLTKRGKEFAKYASRVLSLVDSVPSSSLTVGPHQSALVIRGAGAKVRSGIEQRDSAIRTGATGATTYVVENGRFTIPLGSKDCEKDFPSQAWPVLRGQLKPRSGDAVILCGADDEVSARLGALAAAITLF